jgi:uncharacterized protein (TIGR02271 family)
MEHVLLRFPHTKNTMVHFQQEGPARREPNAAGQNKTIPVIHEQLAVEVELVETAKVFIRKRTEQEQTTVNVPLTSETYRIDRVPVTNQVFDAPPPTRYDGDNMIIPIVREVVETKIRYEVTEEVHVIKTRNEVPFNQQFMLNKDVVDIERIPTNNNNSQNT